MHLYAGRRHLGDGDRRTQSGREILVRSPKLIGALDVEADTVDLGLVLDLRVVDLHRHRKSDIGCGPFDFVERGTIGGSHRGDPVSGEHAEGEGFGEAGRRAQEVSLRSSRDLRGRLWWLWFSAGTPGGVVQQVLERAQAGRRPLQYRDPVVAEYPGLVGGNRRR